MSPSDRFQFMRKAELYREKTGRKPDKLIIVTPYPAEKAVEGSRKLGIEICSKMLPHKTEMSTIKKSKELQNTSLMLSFIGGLISDNLITRF